MQLNYITFYKFELVKYNFSQSHISVQSQFPSDKKCSSHKFYLHCWFYYPLSHFLPHEAENPQIQVSKKNQLFLEVIKFSFGIIYVTLEINLIILPKRDIIQLANFLNYIFRIYNSFTKPSTNLKLKFTF